MRRVRVRIDRLALHGFDGIDGRAVGAAIERELSRALAGPGPYHAHARDRVDAGVIHLDPRPTAAQIGRAVSGSVVTTVRGTQKGRGSR